MNKLGIMNTIAERLRCNTGIYFSESRLEELEQKLKTSVSISPHTNSPDFAPLLREVWDRDIESAVARSLTISETYFFRNPGLWKFIETTLIRLWQVKLLQDKSYKINIWSAACCTGEEPYSLSILLGKLLHDASRWQIFATDINEEYLEEARKALYSRWSLRNCTEEVVRNNFTKHSETLYQLNNKERALVEFSYFNIVRDEHPVKDSSIKFDLILCRNVLIYFREDDAANVLRRLSKLLSKDGLIVVSVHDLWNCKLEGLNVELHSDFALVSCGTAGTTRVSVANTDKKDARKIQTETNSSLNKLSRTLLEQDDIKKQPFIHEGEAEHDTEVLSQALTELSPSLEQCFKQIDCLLASGNNDAALIGIEKALLQHKLSPRLYYLKACILSECGNNAAAVKALQQAIFIDPEYLIAQFALYNISRRLKLSDAEKLYLRNVKRLLVAKEKYEIVPDGDGITFNQLEGMLLKLEERGDGQGAN